MKRLILISVACCLAATQLFAQSRISREGSPETIVRVNEFALLMHAKGDEYCPSYSGNYGYEYIANVSFAGINNNSGGSFYSDFTDIFATVEAGNVYALTITVSNENGEDDYDERVLVWIDWDQNHVFDQDELYDLGVKNVAMGSTEVFTKSIHVPADATPGDTRMRVSLKYYEPSEYYENYPDEEWWGYSEDFYLDPCAIYEPDFEPDLSYEGGMDNFIFGEVEDYSVTVIEPTSTYEITATASPAEGGTASGAGTYAHGAEVSLTATASANYAFESWTENGTEIFTEPTYTFTAEEDRDLVAHFAHLTYKLTFRMENAEGEEIADAIITLNDHTYDEGHYEFPGLLSGTYHYAVSRESYESKEGTIAITDNDVEETVVLEMVTSTVDPGIYSMKAYPNPARDILWVEFTHKSITGNTLILYNQEGKIVRQKIITQTGDIKISMEINGLLPGMYFLGILADEPAILQKVIITF